MRRRSFLAMFLLLALTLPARPARGGEGDNCAVVPMEPARTIRVAEAEEEFLGEPRGNVWYS